MTTYKRIAPLDANTLITEASNVKIVDIRDENSFAAGHMTHALHMDNSNVQRILQQFDFEDPIIVCCYHGNSSQMAAQFIIEQGFEDVYSLDGGFEAWQAQYPALCAK